MQRFRYHAHSGVQRADGLYGGLVVHKPANKERSQGEKLLDEQLLLIGDWYHRSSEDVLAWFLDSQHYGYEVRIALSRFMMPLLTSNTART